MPVKSAAHIQYLGSASCTTYSVAEPLYNLTILDLYGN